MVPEPGGGGWGVGQGKDSILKLRVVFRQLSTYILSHPVEGRLSPAISTNYNCPSPPPIFSPSSTTIFFDNIQTCGVYEWIRARNVNVWIMNIVWQNHYCSTSVSKQKWCVKRSLSYQVPWQPNSQIKGVWCTTDHRLENRCVLRKLVLLKEPGPPLIWEKGPVCFSRFYWRFLAQN